VRFTSPLTGVAWDAFLELDPPVGGVDFGNVVEKDSHVLFEDVISVLPSS
jgi:hypothetical protein